MLQMQSISKVYRTDLIETHALREFSLNVKEGEFVAVTGPSGSPDGRTRTVWSWTSPAHASSLRRSTRT